MNESELKQLIIKMIEEIKALSDVVKDLNKKIYQLEKRKED